MNRVFEHAGDLVNAKVAHNLMHLIAEGFGEDDDTADSQLRSSAVCACRLSYDLAELCCWDYHAILDLCVLFDVVCIWIWINKMVLAEYL